VISQTGSTPNNYLFAGEQFDAALGIYYNRARYYDQRQARFWTMDPAFPTMRHPSSLHRYAYVNQNPVSRIDPTGLDGDIATTTEAIEEDQALNAIDLVKVQQLVEAVEAPEIVAEAPQAFGLLAKTIASLSIGTAAFGSYFAATGSGGGVPVDQAVAEANSNNYDIYRFGNAQGPATLRPGYDYYLNSSGSIDPQNPTSSTFTGASAYRDPFNAEVKALGLSGVLWRVALQNVQSADGLSVVPDGRDAKPNSTLPTGHHTIFPTVQMTPDDFEQRVRSLLWVRSGRVR
jgi:RHS repeat-associated protein